MKFYLGTDRLPWFRTADVPLFVSSRVLSARKDFTRYKTNLRWCIDSGGFTELNLFGRWTTPPKTYVSLVNRYMDEIGGVDWAAPQDAMCEPWILEKAKSWLGGTVEAHQLYTIQNFLELKSLAPHIPFIPTLQGWELDDYLHHVEMYRSHGIQLDQYPTVGLGSVCRRESTDQIFNIVKELHSLGLRLHGFGMKTGGVAKCGNMLASSDSMAWSYAARYDSPRPCPHTGAKCCNHCYEFALQWRNNLIKKAKSHNVDIEVS